jgi:(methylthio)acryloyl-CoA hydratase
MMDMMLTGRTYNAVEGSSIGFSQYVVEKGQGLIKATELAKNISSNRRLSNFAVSYALPRIARAEPDAGLLMESLMLAATMSGDEAAKLARVFLSGTGPKAVPRPESNSDL